ncbi:Sentrin-specific protease [Frankliniella fusca]|uniref:Sentrin-specific protease n=1 Tax=Frankliniella fusca TaxID=407009 RepID=A0AAE1LEZ4_9NEOP|nr:Sentrin-specific protease [Frankliniella fusca]
MDSKFYSEEVKQSTEALAKILGVEKSEISAEKPNGPDLPTSIPEDDNASSAFKTTYNDSPFFYKFNKVFVDVANITRDPEPSAVVTLKRNGLNVPGGADYLLRYMLPYYPMWSRYVQTMVLPDSTNPLSNSAVELRFKLLKEETWVRKKYSKVNRFVRHTIKDTHERILSYQFPANFKKYKKRKGKTDKDYFIELDADDPTNENSSITKKRKKIVDFKDVAEKEFPSKRKVVEKWKKSSVRLPGGYFFAKRTRQYAAKLDETIKEIKENEDQDSAGPGTEFSPLDKTSHSCIKCNQFVSTKDVLATREGTFECFGCIIGIKVPEAVLTVSSDESSAIPPTVSVRKKRHLTKDSNGKLDTFTPNFPWEERRTFPFYSAQFLYTVKGFNLKENDFDSFDRWLNDYIIDSFLQVITDPSVLKEPEACINTISCLALENMTMGLDSVFIKASNSDMLFNDIWLVPSHVRRNHWILFLVLIKTKKIIILDSLPRKDEPCNDVIEHLQILRLVIQASHMHSYGTPLDWSEWGIYYPPVVHIQSNGSDCGVFVCMWANAICTGKSPKNLSKHSNNVRAWMCEELLSRADITPIPIPKDVNSDEDFIIRVYDEMDANIVAGVHKINKPWETLPPPVILHETIDDNHTGYFLASIMDHLWTATSELCGAPNGCKKGNKVMYRCEMCPEYYHTECVGGKKPLDVEEYYLCPKHIQGT